MNLAHLRAFFWLRWRLFANQLRRGGIANRIIFTIAMIGLGLASIGLFVGAVPMGYFLMSRATPLVMMLIWDGLVFFFLMFWMIGLLTELQRSESLSMEKFLHLPVSLTGVFALNYLSSLFSLNLLLFVPTALGLALGLTLALGPMMLMLLPALAAFVLMVSAVTYQFQGWLASLMVDKRRRRTIIVIATLFFILVFQLPNLINILRPWEATSDEKESLKQAQAELQRELQEGKLKLDEYQRRRTKLETEHHEKTVQQLKDTWATVEQSAWFVNAALPPCWLPLAAHGAAEWNAVSPFAGTFGMALIGLASLWRAYRTTVRLYTGDFTAGGKQAAPVAPVAAPTGVVRTAGLVGLKIPWISEQAAVIALAGFRSLTRAPEAKMLLLSPLLMLVIFGGMFWRRTVEMPEFVRPLTAFGGMTMLLFTLTQIVANQFGYDRAGFRIFVLGPASRRDILLGKNLAILPIGIALTSIVVILLQTFYPMRIDRLLALAPQFISMFLIFCMVANFMSIYSPMPVAQGSLKAVNTRFLSVLFNMLFVFFMPLALAPTLVPLGIELALEHLGLIERVPIGLGLSVIVCAAVIVIYRLVISWQGGLLQGREQQILEVVTAKAE